MKYFAPFLFLLNIILWSCQSNFDHRLQEEAKAYTANNCPQQVEEGTMLDSVSYDIKSHTYTLHYSVNTQNEQALQQKGTMLHQLLLNELRNDVNYKEVKDNNVTFNYVYRSANTGLIVYQTNIPATEYNVVHKE